MAGHGGSKNAFFSSRNSQFDPENHQFSLETHLPSPMTGRVYVNLLECMVYGRYIELVNGFINQINPKKSSPVVTMVVSIRSHGHP